MSFKPQIFTVPAVIGLGSGGCRIASQVAVPKGTLKVAVNSSLRDLKQVEELFNISVLAGTGEGSGMDPERGKEDYLGIREQVKNLIKKSLLSAGTAEPDFIFIIASLGHGFGSGSLPEHVKLVKEELPTAIHIIIAITPFIAEGAGPFDRAYKSLMETLEAGGTPLIISNAVAASKLHLIQHRKATITEVLNSVNKAIGNLITVFLEGLNSREVLMGLDKADLSKLLKGIGSLSAIKTDRLADLSGKEIVEALYANMFLRLSPNPYGFQAAIIFDLNPYDDPSIEEIENIVLKLIRDVNLDTTYLKPLMVRRQRQGSIAVLLLTGGCVSKDMMMLIPSEYWSFKITRWLKGLKKRKVKIEQVISIELEREET